MVEPTLFNGDIEFDIETIPKALQEQCLKLEELDRAGDDISYKLRRKTHTLACGMKAAFSVQNYISTT